MLRKIWPYLRAYRWQVAWALAQVFLIAGFELLKPWPLQAVIDYVLGGKKPPTGGFWESAVIRRKRQPRISGATRLIAIDPFPAYCFFVEPKRHITPVKRRPRKHMSEKSPLLRSYYAPR